jgi:hypothetical protein
MATVKIPGIGPVEKKWVYVGGALVAGIVGYAYWNKSRVDVTESDTEVADYTTGTDYAMDSGVDEYVNPGGSQAPIEEDYVTAPTTNAEWSQKAISILVDTGHDPISASLAVGKYMARQDLTSTQANMIRAASAQLGPPPVGSFPITVTPDAPKEEKPSGSELGQVTGIRVLDRSPTTVNVTWNKVPGALNYAIYREGYSSSIGFSFDNVQRIVGLPRGKTTKIRMRAYAFDQSPGPLSPYVSVTTAK